MEKLDMNSKYSLEAAMDAYKSVEGFMKSKWANLLYRLAGEETKDINGCVVEIGSWRGRSTVLLAYASLYYQREHKVYAVDPFCDPKEENMLDKYNMWKTHKHTIRANNTYDEFITNIEKAGCSDIVCPIRTTSEKARQIFEDQPIRFLFIDGCHQPEYVKLDWDLWSPFIPIGGIVAFHDAIASDVAKIVNNTIKTNPNWQSNAKGGRAWAKRIR
jgi:predicted O-methyltransferase YrrM